MKKAQGAVLGGPRLREARKASKVVVVANADHHAANILPIIRAVQKAGATTLREIAEALNARGVQTARGGLWHAMTVKNLMDRSVSAQLKWSGQGPEAYGGSPLAAAMRIPFAFVIIKIIRCESHKVLLSCHELSGASS